MKRKRYPLEINLIGQSLLEFLSLARKFSLLVLACCGASSGSTIDYFPIDSAAVYQYELTSEWIVGGPGFVGKETIRKMKKLDSNRITMEVELDSSGVQTNRMDTCMMGTDRITCEYDVFHIGTSSQPPQNFKVSEIGYQSEHYLKYEYSFMGGSRSAVSRTDWYKEGVGLIKSVRVTMTGVNQNNFIKTLVSINGESIDTDGLISSIVKDGVVGLNHFPKPTMYGRSRPRSGTLLSGGATLSILGRKIQLASKKPPGPK